MGWFCAGTALISSGIQPLPVGSIATGKYSLLYKSYIKLTKALCGECPGIYPMI